MEVNPVPGTILGSDGDASVASSTHSTVSNDGATSQTSSCDATLKCGCTNFEAGNSFSSIPATSSASPIKQWPKCCLKQRTNAILKSKHFCDVTFIVGKGERQEKFPAHKAFLSFGSDVFGAMFCDNWSTSSSEIEILDVEPCAFANLLSFIYTDEVSLSAETVGATLYAAKKYAVVPLEKRCIDYLMENLCVENAFAVLTHAQSFDEKNLMDSCLKLIDEDTSAAISGSGFLEIDSTLLQMVVNRDSLNIREVELFKAVSGWCSAECGRRSLPADQKSEQLVLKEILPLIRFPLMSLKEILCVVAPLEILTHEELMSLCDFHYTIPKPPVNFNSTPRFWHTFKVCRFQETDSPFESIEDPKLGDSIEFKVDREVRFLGVGLYGPVSVPSQYSIKLKLSYGSPLKLFHEESTVRTFDKTACVFDVLVEDPIKLEPGTEYRVWVGIQGPPSFCGKKGVKQVTETLPHDRTFTVTFFKINKNSRTNVEQGQIAELIFTT